MFYIGKVDVRSCQQNLREKISLKKGTYKAVFSYSAKAPDIKNGKWGKFVVKDSNINVLSELDIPQISTGTSLMQIMDVDFYVDTEKTIIISVIGSNAELWLDRVFITKCDYK